jgi:TPR repeat protein
LAAAQAEPLALYALGVMAATGQGETQDTVAAFAFLTSSAKHGYQEALAARDQIATAMTSAQTQRGYEMAKSWDSATKNHQ